MPPKVKESFVVSALLIVTICIGIRLYNQAKKENFLTPHESEKSKKETKPAAVVEIRPRLASGASAGPHIDVLNETHLEGKLIEE